MIQNECFKFPYYVRSEVFLINAMIVTHKKNCFNFSIVHKKQESRVREEEKVISSCHWTEEKQSITACVCKRIMVEWFLHFKNRLCALPIVSRPITSWILSLFYIFHVNSSVCVGYKQTNKRLQCPIHVVIYCENVWNEIWLHFHVQSIIAYLLSKYPFEQYNYMIW